MNVDLTLTWYFGLESDLDLLSNNDLEHKLLNIVHVFKMQSNRFLFPNCHLRTFLKVRGSPFKNKWEFFQMWIFRIPHMWQVQNNKEKWGSPNSFFCCDLLNKVTQVHFRQNWLHLFNVPPLVRINHYQLENQLFQWQTCLASRFTTFFDHYSNSVFLLTI